MKESATIAHTFARKFLEGLQASCRLPLSPAFLKLLTLTAGWQCCTCCAPAFDALQAALLSPLPAPCQKTAGGFPPCAQEPAARPALPAEHTPAVRWFLHLTRSLCH